MRDDDKILWFERAYHQKKNFFLHPTSKVWMQLQNGNDRFKMLIFKLNRISFLLIKHCEIVVFPASCWIMCFDLALIDAQK